MALLIVLPFGRAPATAAAPKLGRTAVIRPTAGAVLVKRKGTRRFVTISREQTIAMGSTVDLSRGAATLTTAKSSSGGTQSGGFRGGAFVVDQPGGKPLTTLSLVDGGSRPCRGTPRAGATGVFARAALRPRRALFGRAHGQFESRGRNSSATIRGTTWITEDLCSGSTVIKAVAGGGVEKRSRGASLRLRPGDVAEDFCDVHPPADIAALATFYCTGTLLSPGRKSRTGQLPDVAAFHLLTGAGPGQPAIADACVHSPGRAEHCTTYRVEDPAGGAGLFDACGLPGGLRAYTLRWRIGGLYLPPPMTVRSVTRRVKGPFKCLERPTFPPYAPVFEPGNPYEPA